MKVKVSCPCETRFEFEVEPVHERMPVAIACPNCGADATALANAVIQQQIAAAKPAPTPTPTTPAASGIRIAKAHATTAPAAAQAAEATAEVPAEGETPAPLCPKHKTEPAYEVCCVCGKPICPKCMEQFGYVCSVYCRQQATLKRIYVPVFAGQKSVVSGKAHALAARLTYATVALLVLLLGFWIWYANFARNPKVVYLLAIPKQNTDSDKPYRPDEFYQLIGPGQLLSVKAKQVSVFDVREQKELWSAPLQSDAEAAAIKAARAKNEEIKKRTPKTRDADGFDTTQYAGLDPLGMENDYDFSEPRVLATSNDVWMAFPNRLMRFDRLAGTRKDVTIPDKILSVSLEDNAILVVSGTPGAQESLTEITLPDGALQTETISTAPVTNAIAPAKAADKQRPSKSASVKSAATANKMPVGKIKELAAQAPPPLADSDDDSAFSYYDEAGRPFIAAGANVVQFKTKLLEHKTISHVAMKPKGKSVLDNGNLTASQGLDVAQEMMNDSRREMTGGMEEEDVSRYQVTLHRRFGGEIPDWTGEVSGPPQFFALKTVDVLAAGQSIYVFDKHNKKLWDAKLTFSVAPHFSGESNPCLETGDALYVADLGMLTRYDLANGNVRWRYNSVGISRVQADARGSIYLDTSTAGPESIQYSQQVNIHDKIHPLLVKLNPETAKVLWSLESEGDHCMFSGKFLYALRNSISYAALHFEQGPDTHFYLRLLNPSSGGRIWSYHQGNRRVLRTDFQKNWILLHFEDEVVVMKFFSL